MTEEELISLEEAERIAREHAKKRIKEGEIKDVDIESTELEETGEGTSIYMVKGHATYVVKKGGIFSKEETAKKYFKAQIHAFQGKIISFTEME